MLYPLPMPESHKTLTPQQAERLAKDLMQTHGLPHAGWTFQWSQGKRRLGETSIRKTRDPRTGKTKTVKAIKLSKHLVAHNPEPIVRDVILHEIAHAIAGLENGHNHVWKAACKKVGAKPQRLADESVQVVPERYAIVCKQCAQELTRRHRRPTPKTLANAYCKHCGPKSLGKLKVIEPD